VKLLAYRIFDPVKTKTPLRITPHDLIPENSASCN